MWKKLQKYKWWIAGGVAAAGASYYMKPEPAPEGWNWGKIALVSAVGVLTAPYSIAGAVVAAGVTSLSI